MVKPNGFQFKQFFIEHDWSAMKVGTDSILLGSWIATGSAQNILDVGTGSGLLAIMLAQKSSVESKILAIDLDEGAIFQANRNVRNCPWSEQISVKQVSFQVLEGQRKFDLIVSNPPYFEPKKGILHHQDPQFIEQKRRQARHTSTLTHEELLEHVTRSLTRQGEFYCVLPEQSCVSFIEYASQLGLFNDSQLMIKATAQKEINRRLLKFTKVKSETRSLQLIVHDAAGHYSEEFKKLCKDYYLNF